MKFTPIVLTLCLFMVGCSRHGAQLQKSITGTWTNDAYTVSFVSDGAFTLRFSNPAHTNITQGSWLVKDGALVCTITYSAEVSAGITSAMKVIRVGDGQLLFEDHGHTNLLIRQ
jgi:hypothetical protein